MKLSWINPGIKLFVVVVIALALAFSFTKPAFAYSNDYITNANSNLCLGINGNYSGAPAIQWTCNSNPDHKWSSIGGSLQNGYGYCLAVYNGAPVEWACNGQSDQSWKFSCVTWTCGGLWEISNYQTGQCLGILNGSKSVGAHAVLWSCNKNQDQTWFYHVS